MHSVFAGGLNAEFVSAHTAGAVGSLSAGLAIGTPGAVTATVNAALSAVFNPIIAGSGRADRVGADAALAIGAGGAGFLVYTGFAGTTAVGVGLIAVGDAIVTARGRCGVDWCGINWCCVHWCCVGYGIGADTGVRLGLVRQTLVPFVLIELTPEPGCAPNTVATAVRRGPRRAQVCLAARKTKKDRRQTQRTLNPHTLHPKG